jgi:2-oxoglutarate ferredoxin oxidoreductase subunit alpha
MSLRLSPPEALEQHNRELRKKYDEIVRNEVRYEEYMIDDAQVVIVSFGTSSRVCKASIHMARERGMKVGMVRPKTLWPFPVEIIADLADSHQVRAFIDVEMNMGQMIEDVKLAVSGRKDVYFYGRTAGMLPDENELLEKIVEVTNECCLQKA